LANDNIARTEDRAVGDARAYLRMAENASQQTLLDIDNVEESPTMTGDHLYLG